MTTSTVENYVKQLYLEQHAADGEMILMGRLATVMGVVPGTATSMVKTLADAGLGEIRAARRRAADRERREAGPPHAAPASAHRTVSRQSAGPRLVEVHDEAEALEHAISDQVLERIDELLGHPAPIRMAIRFRHRRGTSTSRGE